MYKYKGKKYQREDDFLAAYYSDVIRSKPSSPLFVPLADIYYKNNRLALALQTCEAGLEKNPRYHTARFLLAQIYNAMEESEKAVIELEKVVEKKPDNIGATSLLAEISMRTGNVERARELFSHLIDLNPNDKKALTALSHLPSENNIKHYAASRGNAEHADTTLSPDITGIIETGEQVMLGKGVAPLIDAEGSDDEFLMPVATDAEDLAQQLADFENEEKEAVFEETQIEEDIEAPAEEVAPEDLLEDISEEELMEAMHTEDLDEITEHAKETDEAPKKIVEINEPKPMEEFIDELDEESLPPLPTAIEEKETEAETAYAEGDVWHEEDIRNILEKTSPEELFKGITEEESLDEPIPTIPNEEDEDIVPEEDFSASLIDDERPLEAIGEIFKKEKEGDGKETEEIVQRKQAVINNLEGWLKKME